jgi:hypothetical protein
MIEVLTIVISLASLAVSAWTISVIRRSNREMRERIYNGGPRF